MKENQSLLTYPLYENRIKIPLFYTQIAFLNIKCYVLDMKRLWGYISSYKGKLLIQTIIKIIGTCMDLVLPLILNYIIEDLIPKEDVLTIFLYGLLMILCAGIGVLFNVLANRSAAFIAKVASQKLRHDLFNKMEDLSFEDISFLGTPTLSSRISTDIYNVYNAIGMIQRLGIRAPILLMGGLILCFILDVPLALLLLSIIPLILISTLIITKRGIPKYKDIQHSNDALVSTMRENYNGVRIIKALHREEKEIKRFKNKSEDIKNKEIKTGYLMSAINPLMNLFLNLGLVAVCLFGAYRVNDEFIEPAVITTYLLYFTIILNATLSLTRVFVNLSRANASMKRIEEIFAIPYEKLGSIKDIKPSKDINFEHVYFHYGEDNDCIIDLNFTFKANSTLGIIGPTGSSKTTLISLLLGFYKPSRGKITYDHHDINDLDPKTYRALFGIALQNDALFSESIKDNIVFGRVYDEALFQKAIDTSQASEFINNLKDKENTILAQKGSNLSGGQKQRILLARALYSNPSILVLDDSTSALDFKTDAAFRHGLKQNYPHLSLILIASRAITLKDMDNIIVLNDGHVEEMGTHQELINNKGLYEEILSLQEGGKNA